MSENVVGNAYDKYGTSNPIARRLMADFLASVGTLFARSKPKTVLEVGCGEGHLAHQLLAYHRPERFLCTDLSLERVLDDLDPLLEFQQASAYELPFETNSFDLVICCEVLEHLERPAAGLAEVARVAKTHVIISTPWEPVWRAMNMARGKYWSDLGNTPGHIQHFGRRDLRELAARELEILDLRKPLPWTVIRGAPRE
jgi:ubiquinone/menaquinone biosynthesis C-methylase UbiE